MNKLIKGNYDTNNIIDDNDNIEEKDSLENEFEKAALNKLGGSIAYVSRRRVMWSVKDGGKIEEMDSSEDQKVIDKYFEK